MASQDAPDASFVLRMGRSSEEEQVTNALDLQLDLSGRDEVELRYFLRNFFDEEQAGEGIYLSDDGGATFTAEPVLSLHLNEDSREIYLTPPPVDIDDVVVTGYVVTPTNVESNLLPSSFVLQQNYPNPFNPTTQIRYSIPHSAEVQLSVFNMLGQNIATLVDGQESAGWHTASFCASGLSRGTYIYRIQGGEFVSTKKLTLIK